LRFFLLLLVKGSGKRREKEDLLSLHVLVYFLLFGDRWSWCEKEGFVNYAI
jgi:hypothetical protein